MIPILLILAVSGLILIAVHKRYRRLIASKGTIIPCTLCRYRPFKYYFMPWSFQTLTSIITLLSALLFFGLLLIIIGDHFVTDGQTIIVPSYFLNHWLSFIPNIIKTSILILLAISSLIYFLYLFFKVVEFITPYQALLEDKKLTFTYFGKQIVQIDFNKKFQYDIKYYQSGTIRRGFTLTEICLLSQDDKHIAISAATDYNKNTVQLLDKSPFHSHQTRFYGVFAMDYNSQLLKKKLGNFLKSKQATHI